MPDTDPNEVRLTGENSFIRLLDAADGPQLTRVSHWRILYTPAGAGHALFIESDVTGGAVRIYSDNEAMTRWLQDEIERLLYPPFGDTSLPVTGARFGREGDTHTAWTETVRSDADMGSSACSASSSRTRSASCRANSDNASRRLAR